MSNNSDNGNSGCLLISLFIFVILFLYANGGFWWIVYAVGGLFIALFLYYYGNAWWVVGTVGGLLIAYILYINELAWTVYAVGGLFIVWGLIGLVQSYQLKQKAKRLGRIYQEISENWK